MKYCMLILRIGLSCLFLLASITKLIDLNHFALVLTSFGIKPVWLVGVLKYSVPLLEVFLGVGLAFGFAIRTLSAIAIGFFVSTIIIYMANWGHALPYGCGCVSIKSKAEVVNIGLISKSFLALITAIVIFLEKYKFGSLDFFLKEFFGKEFPSKVVGTLIVSLVSISLFTAPWIVGLHRQVPGGIPSTIDISKEGPKVGEQLPELNLLTEDGNPTIINQQSFMNVILFFGSSSCPACKQVLPYLVKFYDDTKIPIIMISDEQPSINKTFREKEKLPFPIYYGSSTEWKKINLTIKPFVIYVSNNGKVVQKGGAHKYDDLLALTKITGV